MQPPKVKPKTKVRTAKPNKKLRPLKRLKKIRNKGLTKPNEIVTIKKIVPLLPEIILLPQREKQARIGSEARTKTFPRLPALDTTRKNIIQENVLNQKTSCSLDNLHIDDC